MGSSDRAHGHKFGVTLDECKANAIGASLQVTAPSSQLAQIPSASRISLWCCSVPDRQLQLPYLAQTKTGIRPWSNARASLPGCGHQAPGCRHARRAESKWPAPGLHLSHDLAAVGLDRALQGAEISGNLLVQLARNHMSQNIALPRRKPSVAPKDILSFVSFPLQRCAVLDSFSHRVNQLARAHRLHQEFSRASLHGRHTGRYIGVPSKKYDGHYAAALDQRFLYPKSMNIGKGEVQDHATGDVNWICPRKSQAE